MDCEEVRQICEKLVVKGFLKKLADGTYEPTPIGRIIAKAGIEKN